MFKSLLFLLNVFFMVFVFFVGSYASAGEGVGADVGKGSSPADNIQASVGDETPTEDNVQAFEQFGEDVFMALIGGKLPSARLPRVRKFGDAFFSSAPKLEQYSASEDVVPVGQDYVVGPGDEIVISAWGMIRGSWRVRVDRSGKITIPEVGTFNVAGVQFGDLKRVIKREFSKYYTNFELDVEMGSLRNIRVYVVGNARKPGAYFISSLSTVINALLAAGGPDFYGSMRKIEIKRNGKTLGVFDVYDFLLKGDKTNDIRLMPEDVVFIPTSGPMVAISGAVKRPSVYELKGGETLLDLLELAGGMTAIGGENRVILRRIVNKSYETFFEGDLKEGSLSSLKRLVLEDGDFVRIVPVYSDASLVEVRGAVFNPGVFYIERGKTRLSEVLRRAGGVLREAGDLVELTRLIPNSDGSLRKRFNLSLREIMEGKPEADFILEHGDVIMVQFVPGWKKLGTVSIRGEVMMPGDYPLHEGERLSDLIERAGGFTPLAYPRGAVFTRESVRLSQEEQLREVLTTLELELSQAGAELISGALKQEDVALSRAFIEQKKRLLDFLKQQARPSGRIRVFVAEPKVLRGTNRDFLLESGDELYIPPKPSTISVLGAVINPGAFLFDPSIGYREYILMAGGYAPSADRKRIYLLKADGVAIRVSEHSRATPWVNSFGDLKRGKIMLEPGDTIVVPIKIDGLFAQARIMNYVEILYKLALSVAVIDRIF